MTPLIDLLEDESTVPDMLLERQHIKESVMEAVQAPRREGGGAGDALWHRTQPIRGDVDDRHWSGAEHEPGSGAHIGDEGNARVARRM